MLYCILRIVNHFHLCNDKCKRQIKNYNLRTAQKTITNCSFFFLSFSLWGKFGERQNKPVTHCITQPADLFRILDDSSLFISAIRICFVDMMKIVTATAEEEYERSFKTNVFVAAFTTSLARLKLYEALDFLGDRCLYYDTDSVIYKTKPGQEKLPLGRYLGQFTDELGGDSIVEFCSGGAKNYGYLT